MGPPYADCEWPGLGSNPFNLMPIIEHHQRVQRRKQRRGKQDSGVCLGTIESIVIAHVGGSLPELGKKLIREDKDLVARHGGRMRLLENLEIVSSSAEIDVVQPRSQQ